MLGIDVGATKTQLACAVDGVVVAEHTVATPEWRTRSTAEDAHRLNMVVTEVFGPTMHSYPLAVGAHGCDSTNLCRQLRTVLREHFTGPVRVVNDAELMPWAMGRPGGIGLVVGTGSIAVSRDEDDELLTAGGWGWILGDEGGASGLVREATRAVLARLDDGHGLDRLGIRLFESFGVQDGPQLAMALSRDAEAHRWGLHAPQIFAAAAEGSVDAARVIADSAERLAEMIAQLRRRGVASRDVVAGGSVIVAQALMRSAVTASLAHRCPEVRLSILDTAPVLGAVALATSLLTGPEPLPDHASPTAPPILDATEAPA